MCRESLFYRVGNTSHRRDIRAPAVIDSLLSVVERKCGNMGCEEKFIAKELFNHEKNTCEFKLIPCPMAFCKAQIPLRGMFGHMESKHK